MSADAIAELKQAWFSRIPGLEGAIHAILDQVGFTDAYVARIAAIPRRPSAALRPKVVKDNVWGMVELDKGSQLLLDSPVVQRLRHIRQLGLTYLTYPSAEHTRFSHSLGMYCVVYHLLNSIRKNQVDAQTREGMTYGYGNWVLSDALCADLLHAAILHDVGHMPFSHATEHAVTQHKEAFVVGPTTIDRFMVEPELLLKKNLKLAELLSLLVILSPRFTTFYQTVVRPDGGGESIFRIASLIAGKPPKADERGAAELISGTAVDADKIDYINRDAQACGIPVGIDFARLFLRSAFLRVPKRDLEQLTHERGLPDATMVFIVNASGVDTIEELAHARTSLYHRVYLHQVTLCAEAFLERGLHALALKAEKHKNVLELWADTDDGLLSALSRSPYDEVRKFGESLRTRVLPKRALVVGKRLVTPRVLLSHFLKDLPKDVTPYLFKATVGLALEQLRNPIADARVKEIEAMVEKEAGKLVESVKVRREDLAPKGAIPNEVLFLPIRNISAPHKDCLIVENGQLLFSSDRNIADEQSDALEIFKAQAYFVGPPEWREFNAIAAAKVLAQLPGRLSNYEFQPSLREPTKIVKAQAITGLIVDIETAARRAGVDMERLHSISSTAANGGFFDDCPHLFPHDPNCPHAAIVASQLQQFSGEGAWNVTVSSTLAFVSQFPPRLRNALLEMLKSIQLLDRGVIASSMMTVLERIAGAAAGKRLVVTGFSPDSGNLTRMLFEHELKKEVETRGWQISKSIEGAFDVMDDDSILVLCDDNIVSGSQASCQLWAWMGIPKETWPPEMRSEQGIFHTPLRPSDQESLKASKIAIAVAVGTDEADRRLRTTAAALGIVDFLGLQYAHPLEEYSLNADGELTTLLQEVGRDVLAWARFGKRYIEISRSDQEDCDRDALGYHGKRGLLATGFNVPVSTCAALWCPGIFRGQPWVPLMIRRGYLNKLVVG